MQQHVILQRIHAHDKIRPQHRSIEQLLFEPRDFLVQLVEDLGLAPPEDLLAVGDAARNPALEQVVSLCEFGGARDGAVFAVARADEQHHAAASAYFLDYFCGAPEMRGGHFERDDVDALPYSVDVARVGGVPQRSDVALVGFGCEEELEGDIGGRGGVVEEGVGLVMR